MRMEEPCFDVLRTREQLGYYHSHVLKETADLFLKGPIYTTNWVWTRQERSTDVTFLLV